MSLNAVFAPGWDDPVASTWYAYSASGATQTVADGSGSAQFVWDAAGSSAPNDYFAVSESQNYHIECRKSGLLTVAVEVFTDVSTENCWMQIMVSAPGNPGVSDSYSLRMNPDTYSPKMLIPVPAGAFLMASLTNRTGSSRTLTYWEADLRMILLA